VSVTCTSSQSPDAPRARENAVDDAERRQIDEPGVDTRHQAGLFVLMNDVLARHCDDEFVAALSAARAL
jgi:hypothetical protein